MQRFHVPVQVSFSWREPLLMTSEPFIDAPAKQNRSKMLYCESHLIVTIISSTNHITRLMEESSDTNINMVLDTVHRMLNATASNVIISKPPNNNSNSSFSNSTTVEDLESAALRETLRSYGSLFVILLLIFCVLQKAFPKIYNVRSWSKTSGCDLAEIPYGPFNWIWRVFWVDDDDIQDQCGMDTLCFFRMLRFGRKVSLMGCFNAIWLLPLYRVAIHEPPVARTFSYKPLATISIVHVPSGSTRLIGTVVAAYVLFLYAMWLVLYEFEWFIHYRHRFLEKRMARNYAVYVSGIPEDYRSSHKLAEYFRRRCCPNEADVLEAHCTLTIPQLEAKVAKRKVLQHKLEHAQALEELRGATVTTCNVQRNGMEFVGSVQVLQEELNALDVAIAHASNHVRRANSYGEVGPMEADEDHSDSFGTAVCALSENNIVNREDVVVDKGMNDLDHPQQSDLEQPSLMEALEPNDGSDLAPDMNSSLSSYPEDLLVDTPDDLSRPILMPPESALKEDQPRNLKQQIQQAGKYGTDNVKKLGMQGVQRVKWAGEMGVENVLNFAEVGTNIVEDAFGTAVTIVVGREEGTPREAGFVVFTKLYSVHSALQMVHHRIPNVMKVTEAPVPEEIFWRNVGLPARARRLGKYLSLVATTILCFFWSIPVAFISSLTQVSSLEHLIPFLKDWLAKWPGLATLLGQLAPLLLYLLNSLLLPILLREFSKWEGHVGKSSLQASVYVKMAAFMVRGVHHVAFRKHFNSSPSSDYPNILCISHFRKYRRDH